MTAEIAIANRTALALAADSAVTIRVGNKTKIYDSAEKIFELSRRQPIGLMIYNNVEFVNVPLDVVIRKFRSEEKKIYKFVKPAADHFLAYIEKFSRDGIDEKSHLFPLLFEHYRSLQVRVQKTLQTDIITVANTLKNIINQYRSTDKGGPAPAVPDAPRPESIFDRLLDEETKKEQSRPLKGFLDNVTVEMFVKRYGDAVDFAIQRAINVPIEMTDARKAKLQEYGLSLVKSSKESGLLTGLVFGGFGSENLFPEIHYCEIDGVYFDSIKILSRTDVKIDRAALRAEMIPFAQKEMAERFIYGLDSDLEDDINKFVREAMNKILDTKATAFTQAERDNVKTAVYTNFSSMINKLKTNSRKTLLDMVSFMSKKELGEMAQALVELTSKKRRFSTEQETVGGPIDVAIITRSEGFIWIQRKHYFGPELNQNFIGRAQTAFTQIGAKDDGKAPASNVKRAKRRSSQRSG